MARDKNAKINIVEYYTMQQMLESVVSKGLITQREMDLTLERIAGKMIFLMLYYGHRDYNQQPTQIINITNVQSDDYKGDRSIPPISNGINMFLQSEQKAIKYISLTEIARFHCLGNPSYIIQSWLLNENTLAFLDLWEQENNPAYDVSAYLALLEKKKSSSFTVTAKQWISRTKAVGIVSKQGKRGGTFAHPIMACEFATWLSPKFMMLMLKMSQFKDEFY